MTSDAYEPLSSPYRTPEQMEWIHARYKIDGLGRLARANRHYADEHGEYLPDVSALAHAALTEVERLHEALHEICTPEYQLRRDRVEIAREALDSGR